jgi:arginase
MPPNSTSPQPRKIALIACSIGWGSGFEAAERGPSLLLRAGLAESVGATTTINIPATPSMAETTLEGDAVEQAIMQYASRVSEAVVDVIAQGYFPVIIGGDHTSALGFHSGLAKAYGQTGIVWVDTHPDLNTPDTSPSGNIHGMVLAGLLGRGSEPMCRATSACQTRQEHVAMVGVRDIDLGEQRWLDEGKIHCMTMDTVRERGLDACLHHGVETANQAPAGYGLTIDIDVLDPSQAPFVATPVDDGIFVDELAEAIATMPHTERLLGLEVIEFTPRNEGDAEEACRIIATLINAVTGVPVV